MDGSSIDQNPQQEKRPTKGAASSTMTRSMMQDTGLLHPHKRPRMDMRQGNHQQQVIQQILQNNQIPHLPAMLQQQRPPLQIPQQTPRSCPNSESGLCAQRLMRYMYDLRNRPENSITYWRKFVEEYFAPTAKKRWCLSFYTSSANDALGDFPQASMDEWQCGICGSKPGKGFQASYEVLPMVHQVNFANGVIDELLYLEMPREGKLLSGMMVLDYANAVQQSVHKQLRVVRKGHLRIIFTTDLKIFSWEFCTRYHEELLPRRMLVDQVDKLLQVAKDYEASVNESGSSGVPLQDMQAFCNMFVEEGCQMARYVNLQISEVVNSMKDMIDFSWAHKMGPIKSLKNYTQQDVAKLQSQEMKLEQVVASQNLPSDQSKLNKLMAMHPGRRLSAPTTCFPNNFSPSTGPLNNYQYLIRNNPNPGQSLIQSGATFSGLNQMQPVAFQGDGSSSFAGQVFHDMLIKNQQQTSYGNQPLPKNNDTPSQENQQFLQEMGNKGASHQSYSALNAEDNVQPEMVGGLCSSAAMPKDSGQVLNVSGNIKGEIPGEIDRVMPSTDASKQDATKNNCFSSSKSDDEEQDLLEHLNLDDLDNFQELLDGI